MTYIISPWTLTALNDIKQKKDRAIIADIQRKNSSFEISLTSDSLLIKVSIGKKKPIIAFRMAYTPTNDLTIERTTQTGDKIDIFLQCGIGSYHVHVHLPDKQEITFRYITNFKPGKPICFPFWPRDILLPGEKQDRKTSGKIHIDQKGCRSGILYFSLHNPACSCLYMQNLTALNDYCEQTKTSCADTVGGNWPEIGFSLPSSNDQPLVAHKTYTLSDAIIVIDPLVHRDKLKLSRHYIDMLAQAYLMLPLPETILQDWLSIVEKGITDLRKAGCWSQVDGQPFLNAYVCDYKTPPEIMVQLAVLLPLLDYVEWRKVDLPEIKIISKSLPSFYKDELQTIVRWLPSAEKNLTGDEEHKKPMIMDSWYLHHPLLNLSRMALKGDKSAEKLFLNSLPYATKVARRFKYNWPVFYHMKTLEAIKAETKPGKGGEKDVAGLYAHVMLQAWELTGKKQYLTEAKRAANTLRDKGLDLLYQANNTAFSAGALIRLHKITGKQLYLDLSYCCLANIFRNAHLWNCGYGYGKHFPSFFGLFPLNDAPYTASYEEQEVFCAFHEYIRQAEPLALPFSVRLLVTEYIRYLINRAAYYYPPMLSKKMLADEPKTGELVPELWIALEDLQDGWKKSGEVGQEVYGAGNAFGILPRHGFIVPGQNFMVFVEYPVSRFRCKQNTITYQMMGTSAVNCKMYILKNPGFSLPVFKVVSGPKHLPINGKRTAQGHIYYTIGGDHKVKITW